MELQIKKYRIVKILGIIISSFYGLFVINSLQRLYATDSGDINAYIDFFNDIDIFTTFNEYSLIGDGIFRVVVIFLGNFFNIEIINVLSLLAFIMSTIVFSIYITKIRSREYLIYLLPLLFLVFFTPMVTNLFASSIRSGLALTILLLAIVYSKGILKYLLLGFSATIHLSMLPIISLYFLFQILNKIKTRSTLIFPIVSLIFFSFLLFLISFIFNFNVTKISSSIFYNILIFCLGLLILFTNKKAINNIYGFISIGLIFIYFFGLFFDISFIRYIAIAIILYFLFLVFEGGIGTIKIFTLGYFPFFLLTTIYTIINIA